MNTTKSSLAVKPLFGDLAAVPKLYSKYKITTVLEVPVGECPIPLRELTSAKDFPTFAEIVEWFHRVRDFGLESGVFYTAVAISYWARCEYDCYGHDYEQIHDFIMDYAERRGEVGESSPRKKL